MVQPPGTCERVPPALPRQGEPCVQLNKMQGATSVGQEQEEQEQEACNDEAKREEVAEE